MEELLKKLVNLGIGATKTLQEEITNTFKKAEDFVNELIAKGESASDETSQKVKELVDKLLDSVKEYESKVKEVSESLLNTLKELREQVNLDITGSKKLEELNQKLEELSKKIEASK